MRKSGNNLWAVLGPGILYTAAAVGVSHLVYSTRSGAVYGLAMIPFILFFCLIKYPGIRFGSEFAASTGRTLVDSYISFGRYTLWLFGLSQLLSMVFITAAIGLVTTSLINAVFGVSFGMLVDNVILLVICAVILITGRYHILERLTKGIVILFTLLIILTTISALFKLRLNGMSLGYVNFDGATMLYVVAMAGYMPTPLDASVLQSLWARAKARDFGREVTVTEARLDFNIGFVTTFVLAVCFVLLGMVVMYCNGITPEKNSIGFANQVIRLFTELVGNWAYYPIGIAAITVMFSTLITVMDGYPRVIEALAIEMLPRSGGQFLGRRFYDWVMVFLVIVSLTVMATLMKTFEAFIDMTSVIAFLVGPFIAWLNHRSMFGGQVPAADQPGSVMRLWSGVAIMIQILISAYYIYLRIAG
ncbi:MAG: divalent metal cation transporter [Deltaproteobacteria bacterium]|nr:divalent metal cation transporter [Deltaproteobacteria bacterium]